MTRLEALQREVTACERCPRLRAHCQEIARVKRRAYRDQAYWGKPVPSFGDPHARLLIVGLAPGAHGSNRTGRMFTGDGSGNFLYKVLFDTGFASQPDSLSRHDGLRLDDCYITAAGRCAPPANKPTPEELRNCRPFLERELGLLRRVRVVVALGRIAFDIYLGILRDREAIAARNRFVFAHNRVHDLGAGLPALISSYHPSQQNTSTGRLTEAMLRDVFRNASSLLAR
jgi:uracil-DNA glycosylase family 4